MIIRDDLPERIEPWKVLKSDYLLDRWWMRLRVDHVQLPNGNEITEFHVSEYPDWGCVICLTEQGQVIMVEQYRHGIGRASLEFPAGAITPGEGVESAVRRELLEETGYQADDWVQIAHCAPEPSKHDYWAHFFVARNARLTHQPHLDDEEYLQVRLVSPQDLPGLAENGIIVHGTHLMALYKALYLGILSH